MTKKEKIILETYNKWAPKGCPFPKIGTCPRATNGTFQTFKCGWPPRITIDHYVKCNSIERVVKHEIGHYIYWANGGTDREESERFALQYANKQ